MQPMARSVVRVVAALAALLCVSLPQSSANATSVKYTVASLGGNAWRYDYTLTNIDLTRPFDELTVFFDPSVYELLSAPLAPAEWDPIVVQPDTGIPSDGFYDVLKLSGPVTDISSISGFSVSFRYLSTGSPGAQPFTLLDSSGFITIQTGRTEVPGAVVVVPEPPTALLLLLGVSLIFATMTWLRRPAAPNRSMS